MRVQALGDSVGDDGLALFFEQLHQTLLLGHKGVDLSGFAVQEGGDEGLLFGGRQQNGQPFEIRKFQ